MQFYKYEGILAEKPKQDKDRQAAREEIRRIAAKSNLFHRRLKKNAFFFVSDISDSVVTLGILFRDTDGLNAQLSSFLRAIGIDLKETTLEEVTFRTVKNMLSTADSNGYIADDDTVLEQFNLSYLNVYSGDYVESIIENAGKRKLYTQAEHFLARDTLTPELDRIYMGKAKSNAIGHPVHYMIETDDTVTANALYRLLLSALHANGRIRNRRYACLSFSAGDDFPTRFYHCLYESCIGGAVVVQYRPGDDTEDEYASGGREAIEKVCRIMKQYCNQVLTVFCMPRECGQSKNVFFENLGNTSFVEIREEFASGARAEDFFKMIARERKIRTDKNLFSRLEAEKEYLAPDLRGLFEEWYNDKLKTGIYPQYKEIMPIKKEVLKAAPKGTAYEELMEMVGLSEAKKVIGQALAYYKAQKVFADKGMQTDRLAMHMVFTGNPGTAKTSAARLFAKIMRDNGLLSRGHLIEVGRGDLVGRYVGWTAPTIQKKFRQAQGGVLFIDEAYSLVDDRSGSFGDEAINTIVQEMENHRDDVVVIFAGYPREMEKFLQKNPGLRSRIAFHVPFADYNTEELCEIANQMAKQKGLRLAEGACRKLSLIFEKERGETDFGNGRYVRNTIEKAKMAQAARLIAMDYDSVKASDISTILAEDIEMPAQRKQTVKQIGFSL